MKTAFIHQQTKAFKPRFHSLKNSMYYIQKVTGTSGIGPPLRTIINPPDKKENFTPKDLYVPDHLIKPGLPSITNILHWHQPLGNVAKGIYKGVKELMDVLYEYYLMQLEVWEKFILKNPHTGYIETVHLTGTLITWMAQEHPEWLQRFVRLVQGKVTGNPGETPHFELFVSPYFESLASTMPLDEAVRQTHISIDVMNFFGMTPSGYWLVERIWEPGYFARFTKELRKLGINKAAIDDHLFYKMSDREIRTSGNREKPFSEKDLRGYYILDDEYKDKDPFYILPANRDYRQARPYWLSEISRKGGRFISYWLQGYLRGSISKEKVVQLFKSNKHIFHRFFVKHPLYSFDDESLEYVIFKDDFITLLDGAGLDENEKNKLTGLWKEAQKDRYSADDFLVWAGDGEKPTNLWRYMGDRNRHKANLKYAQQWLYGELKSKTNNHYANYLPADQLIERSTCRGYITLPFGAYKEMTWWSHTTAHQERLNELITKIETLKTQLLHYHNIAENLGDEVISDEEILLYEKLSNTEITKYQILLKALENRGRLAHIRNNCIPGFFLTKTEEMDLIDLEKGIPWKNFWLKYAESYKYHRLWLFLYERTVDDVDNDQLQELILNLLGRATVNCGSWHGVFGGRYLANLRNDMVWGIAAAVSVYLYALEEKGLFKKGDALLNRFDVMGGLADELRQANIRIKEEKKKSIPDIIVMTCRMLVIISIKNGGTLFDWIYFDTGNPLSVINTINLIKEPYHDDAKKMVSWFEAKINLYHQFIAIADTYLDDRDKGRFSLVHNTRDTGDFNADDMNSITYTELQKKISSLKPVYNTIMKKDPANIKIISLYQELLERPVFSGTKTKTKPIQNLNVVGALKDYDTRLPVNQIVRLYDRNMNKEIGSFGTADFELVTLEDRDELYEVVIKAEAGAITLKKQIHLHKINPLITFIYEISTVRQNRNIEAAIENNTNISFLQETIAWFELNGRVKKITGITEESSVHSLNIYNREDNIIQSIRINPEQNRLVIQPRYSVSQGLRLFETTLQYIRYTFIVPLYLKQDTPSTVMISHSLDSSMRREEEDDWIMKQ